MIIDVSGYSYSGKGAVVDILRDFSSLEVHHKEFEFLLLRATDGLFDLRNNLINNYSEIRVDMALRRFINLTKTLSEKPTSILKPTSFFTPPGQDYSNLFPRFDEHTINFINQISSDNVEFWPFPSLYKSSCSSFIEKLNKLISINRNTIKYTSYISKEKFDNHLNSYLRKVLFSRLTAGKTKVVTSNMLEVYISMHNFKTIQPCKLIIVDRDPRGIFTSIPGNIDDIDNEERARKFINKYKFQRSKEFIENHNHDNILSLKFEDIFKDFKLFIKKISIFLDEPEPQQFKNFSFDRSKENSYSWMTYRKNKAIKMIENELSEYIDS